MENPNRKTIKSGFFLGYPYFIGNHYYDHLCSTTLAIEGKQNDLPSISGGSPPFSEPYTTWVYPICLWFNGNSRILKWRYCVISGHILGVYPLNHSPYMGLIYIGRYLHFRILEFPLTGHQTQKLWRDVAYGAWICLVDGHFPNGRKPLGKYIYIYTYTCVCVYIYK